MGEVQAGRRNYGMRAASQSRDSVTALPYAWHVASPVALRCSGSWHLAVCCGGAAALLLRGAVPIRGNRYQRTAQARSCPEGETGNRSHRQPNWGQVQDMIGSITTGPGIGSMVPSSALSAAVLCGQSRGAADSWERDL